MRTKHTFRLPPELAARLADYASRKRVAQAQRAEAAFAACAQLRPSSDEVEIFQPRCLRPSKTRKNACSGVLHTYLIYQLCVDR
jgi:hypothetical protein